MAPWFIHSLHPFFYIQKGKSMENEKKTVLEAEEEALSALEKSNSFEELTSWKNTYLSKKSHLAQLMGLMRNLPAEEKAAFGKLVNDTRKKVESAFEEKMQKAQAKALEEKL
ncbi:MAG TPA: hypothetical protein DD384_01185 [Firmicutes bacterium]|nr:hypothetical protein [Bacillota bacterium]